MVASGRQFDVIHEHVGGSVRALGVLARLNANEVWSTGPNEIRLNGDRLEWRASDDGWGERASANESLWRFMELADETNPEAFLSYARAHGVLGIDFTGTPGLADWRKPELVEGTTNWYWEPIEAWRLWARNAKTLVYIGELLRNATESSRIDFQSILTSAGLIENQYRTENGDFILPEHPPYFEEYRNKDGEPLITNYGANILFYLTPELIAENISRLTSVDAQRQWLAEYINTHWMKRALITPTVAWNDSGYGISFHLGNLQGAREWIAPSNPLFSVLTAQVVSTICSDLHVGQCERCGDLYPSKVKVRTDQPNYCADCRTAVRRATNRDAARRRYEQRKAAAGS